MTRQPRLILDQLKSITDTLHRQLDTNEKYWSQEDRLIYNALASVYQMGYRRGYRRLGVKTGVYKPSTPKKNDNNAKLES